MNYHFLKNKVQELLKKRKEKNLSFYLLRHDGGLFLEVEEFSSFPHQSHKEISFGLMSSLMSATVELVRQSEGREGKVDNVAMKIHAYERDFYFINCEAAFFMVLVLGEDHYSGEMMFFLERMKEELFSENQEKEQQEEESKQGNDFLFKEISHEEIDLLFV